MTLATNNRMTHDPRHANAGVLGTYVSDMPRHNANIFRRTPMSSPAASPSLSSVVDPSLIDPQWSGMYYGEGQHHLNLGSNIPNLPIGNYDQSTGEPIDNVTVAPALHTQSIDLASVPAPAAAPAKPVVAAPALITGNARGSMKPPAALSIPNQRIPMGEALMRIGGAGVAASGQGGLAAIGAATNAYGQVQDANRQAEMEAFAIEEARRKSIADRMLKGELAEAKNKDKDAAQNAKALVSLQNANAVLQGFDDYDNVTGMGYWFAQKWDQLTGNERENVRLKINSMKVDRVLANIAQTKGAISEKEMDIFMSDQPAWTAGEDIWRKWVTDYRDALLVMHTNLANGTTVAPSGGAASNSSNSGLSAEANNFLNGG